MKQFFTTFLLFGLSFCLFGQKNVTTVGIQFKPIVPIQFFSLGDVNGELGALSVTYAPKFGNTFGMVIRKGFTNHFSVEVGIGFVKRNYELTVIELEDDYKETVGFGFIGYELPMQALYYVQLTKKVYLNTAAGISLDFFPSDIVVNTERLSHFSYRYAWVRTALLANVGAEYRTKKDGYFYLGFSYHRPFKAITISETTYVVTGKLNRSIQNQLNGQYLTLDLRYFFHEAPSKPSAKKTDGGKF
jgi:hypothetical protein